MAAEVRHTPLGGRDVSLLDPHSLSVYGQVGEVGLEEVEAILAAGETETDAGEYLAERYHIADHGDRHRIIDVARRRLLV